MQIGKIRLGGGGGGRGGISKIAIHVLSQTKKSEANCDRCMDKGNTINPGHSSLYAI